MDKNNSPKVSILKKRIMKEKPIPHKNNILIKKEL